MTSQLLLSFLVLCVGWLVGVYADQQCSVTQEYSHSYPLGKTKVEGAHILTKNVSLNECLSLCCQEGAELCQYVWVLKGYCVGLPCHSNKTACSPVTVEQLPSTLVSIKYNSNIQEGNQTTSELTTSTVQPEYIELASQLDNSTLHRNSSAIVNTTVLHISSSTSSATSHISSRPSTSHNVQATTHPLVIVPSLTTPVMEKTNSSSVTMASPTPAAGSKVITVATDAINRSKEITLPTDNVKIFASTWPELSKDVKYSWQWSKVFGPSKGFLSVIADKEASLTGLVEGVYGIKVSVTSDDGSHGETYVNVTVHSAPRVNKPPHPVITPSDHLLLHLPTDSAILEATSSTDDYKADEMTYKWEEISGPMETRMPPSFDQVLYLKDLVAGTYIIKLTATDVDGASNYTIVNITVLPAVDNPPIANAGSAKKLLWPHNRLILYGNASFDDNGIVSYKWQKTVGPIVDMQGSSAAILELNDLQLGDYVFTLTVTDKSDQQSSAEVSVAVVEEANKPPVANAGPNKEIRWPVDSVLLDGSSSNDDQQIVQYQWMLVKPQAVASGDDVMIGAPHTVRTNVTRLRVRGKSPTVYEFNLTVTDQHNLSSWDSVLVTVTKDATIPPTIVVQRLVIVSLPQHLVILNATQSHDDFGITSYQWTPYPQNLAIGEMADDSEHSPVLFFINFVDGVYLFNLTVCSKYNARSSVVVNVTVLPDVHEKNLVQLYLTDDDSNTLTLDKLNLLKEMIRNELGVNTKVITQDIRQLLSNTVVEFYVLDTSTDKPYLANYVVDKLDESSVFTKLNSEFSIMGIETKVCQTNCSGHGSCDYYSKTCKCNLGWMANPFRSVHGKKGLNCDWSILYLVLILLAPAVLAAILVWFICCCCYKKKKRVVSNRRVRYALLPEESHSNGKSSRHTMNSSSIMVSETETEEEILFDKKSKRKMNNDLSKYGSNAQLINPAKLQ